MIEAWVAFAVIAASAQTVRFALQKVVASDSLSPAGATFARFVWSAPLACLLVLAYAEATGATIVLPAPGFWGWAIAGGIFQIVATVLTVTLFASRAFAVGITFKKTEVLITAIFGFVLLGDRISIIGAGALLAGFLAVLLLAKQPHRAMSLDRSVLLGLGSGVFFALSAVAYRAATLAVPGIDPIFIGGVTLSVVTAWQTLSLGAWLAIYQPGQVTAVLRGWRTTAAVGVFSLIGSWSWFSAFSLANAAYVFAVGQVELILSLIVGCLWFGERLKSNELAGAMLLTISIVVVVAAA